METRLLGENEKSVRSIEFKWLGNVEISVSFMQAFE